MNTKTFEEILSDTGMLYYKSVGVSMQPLIREGRDFIIIKKRPEGRLKKYDVVLFRRSGVEGRGAYVLHRILKVNTDGTYWIVGDNCYSGEIVKEENIFGILSAVNRKGKLISESNFGYRMYVHLWCDLYPIRFFVLRYKRYPIALLRKIKKAFHEVMI